MECPGANEIRNRPLSSVVKDVTGPFSFSTTNAAFAKAFESGRPGLDGPPWTGPTVIAPSIPVPASGWFSAGAKPENITRNTRIIGNFRGWSELQEIIVLSFAHRKCESQHHVIGCCALHTRLHDPACRTTADRMAAHRKLDRRRDDLCEGGFRNRASER